MVSVAQLVEPRIVIPVVVGSSPIVHPNDFNDLENNSLSRPIISLHKTFLVIPCGCGGLRIIPQLDFSFNKLSQKE